MNYDELSGKSILLLGKPRALNFEEFETLLKLHDISLCPKFEEGVALVIEGKLMNPLEQDESSRLYTLGVVPIVAIEGVEQWLCGSIEPNRLLMSLKLSRNQERLVDFIKNRYISDELFFKLLKLYDWQGEGLFDNDTNRDVTAALISRFYQDIERNHNVQYAMSGLAHLIQKYGTTQLIEAISELSPIAKEFKTSSDRTLAGVLDAMALHPQTSDPILRQLMNGRAELLARRVPLALETELLALKNETIDQLLSYNETLSAQGADRLEALHPQFIAQSFPLDEERFNRLRNHYAVNLASNTTLSVSMQQTLMELDEVEVNAALASNISMDVFLLAQLYESGRYNTQIAGNSAVTPQQCEALWMSNDSAVLNALAANTSTPIEILYQLGLDSRYERSVKTNAAFGKHIQTHNIGWQV
ncbi:MAG: hypothetical protein WC680_07515 [Sulfuricurvum sp.]|jgi:hypothetical protein